MYKKNFNLNKTIIIFFFINNFDYQKKILSWNLQILKSAEFLDN
jgi:hypothetical protein